MDYEQKQRVANILIDNMLNEILRHEESLNLAVGDQEKIQINNDFRTRWNDLKRLVETVWTDSEYDKIFNRVTKKYEDYKLGKAKQRLAMSKTYLSRKESVQIPSDFAGLSPDVIDLIRKSHSKLPPNVSNQDHSDSDPDYDSDSDSGMDLDSGDPAYGMDLDPEDLYDLQGGSRNKRTAGRKRSAAGRKRSIAGRKRSAAGRKRSAVRRKRSAAGRKRSTVGRKRSTRRTAGRKRSARRTARRKRSIAGRKRSTRRRPRSTRRTTRHGR